jgi:cell wall-associated NlpC family hydrolase
MIIHNYVEMCEHFLSQYPLESCGIISNGTFYRVNNVSSSPGDSFKMDDVELLKLQMDYKIDAIVHTHCYTFERQPLHGLDARTPSTSDYINQKKTGVPWLIYALDGENVSKPVIFPQSYDTPLLGREFIYYVNDCYSIVRDYYYQNMGITLPELDNIGIDFSWEEGKKGHDCKNYYSYLQEWGFYEVSLDDIQIGDVIVMNILGTNNHIAVYSDNNTVMQQLVKNVSTTVSLSKMRSFITHIFRYKK